MLAHFFIYLYNVLINLLFDEYQMIPDILKNVDWKKYLGAVKTQQGHGTSTFQLYSDTTMKFI